MEIFQKEDFVSSYIKIKGKLLPINKDTHKETLKIIKNFKKLPDEIICEILRDLVNIFDIHHCHYGCGNYHPNYKKSEFDIYLS
jgi:hypothetical protein